MKKYIFFSLLIFSILINEENNKVKLTDNKDNAGLINHIPDVVVKRTYFGGWPINTDINNINGPDMIYDCPGDIGCECSLNKECVNDNCKNLPRGGYCMPKNGDIFPDFSGTLLSPGDHV